MLNEKNVSYIFGTVKLMMMTKTEELTGYDVISGFCMEVEGGGPLLPNSYMIVSLTLSGRGLKDAKYSLRINAETMNKALHI